MGELNNSGRDWYHDQIYTNSCWPKNSGRQEIVMFNEGTLAVPFYHVKECKGWYKDNTCTCPKDDCDD